MSAQKAQITKPFEPYKVGLSIADQAGVEGHTFVDPLRFAQLIEEGFAELEPDPPPALATEDPAAAAQSTAAATATSPAPRRNRSGGKSREEG